MQRAAPLRAPAPRCASVRAPPHPLPGVQPLDLVPVVGDAALRLENEIGADVGRIASHLGSGESAARLRALDDDAIALLVGIDGDAERAGADALVVQGHEAGGHRAAFSDGGEDAYGRSGRAGRTLAKSGRFRWTAPEDTTVGLVPAGYAEGALLTDVDGNSYIDLVQSWGALLFGHAHPAVVEAVSEVTGHGLVYGPTKTYERRSVPIPRSMCDELGAYLATRPADPEAFVFTAPDGGPLRHHNFYARHFRPAVVAAAGGPGGTGDRRGGRRLLHRDAGRRAGYRRLEPGLALGERKRADILAALSCLGGGGAFSGGVCTGGAGAAPSLSDLSSASEWDWVMLVIECDYGAFVANTDANSNGTDDYSECVVGTLTSETFYTMSEDRSFTTN